MITLNSPGCYTLYWTSWYLMSIWSGTFKNKKIIGVFWKLQNLIPRLALITIYKAFVNLHYVDILYDWVCDKSFQQKLESIQYNVCLAKTGAMHDTSTTTKIFNNFLNQNLKKPIHMLREMLITLRLLKLDTTSSKTLSFLLQILNGKLDLLFRTQKVLVFSKIVSSDLLQPHQVRLLIVTIIKKLDLPNYCMLVWIIAMNTNLSTISIIT